MKPAAKLTELRPRKVESLMDQIQSMQDRIMQRAYDLFLGRGSLHGRDLADWFAAESELTWKPAVELIEKGDEIVVSAPLAGIEPKDLDVRVTPDQLLIKAATRHEHKEEEGTVHFCELQTGELFRCIQLPKKIDPDKVRADFSNGLLRISAAIAKEDQARKVQVAGA